MRRDAEVEPKCLSKSLVMRKKRDTLERVLEAKKRRRKRESRESGERRERRESDHGALHHHFINTEQCP